MNGTIHHWTKEARKLRSAGWSLRRIAQHLRKPSSTIHAAVRDISAPKQAPASPVSGAARGLSRKDDAQEAWLRANDPEYDSQRRNWQPRTDALALALDGSNAVHSTLDGLRPILDTRIADYCEEFGETALGCYRRPLRPRQRAALIRGNIRCRCKCLN